MNEAELRQIIQAKLAAVVTENSPIQVLRGVIESLGLTFVYLGMARLGRMPHLTIWNYEYLSFNIDRLEVDRVLKIWYENTQMLTPKNPYSQILDQVEKPAPIPEPAPLTTQPSLSPYQVQTHAF